MKYEFMKPDKFAKKNVARDALKKCLADEYRDELKGQKVAITEELIVEYLRRIIDRKKAELDVVKIKERMQEELPVKITLLKQCIKELEKIVENEENYYADLVSMIFWGLLYADPSNDIFQKSDDKTGAKKVKDRELGKAKEEIKSVWRSKSNDNKINKEVVRNNYPIPVVTESYVEGESEITSLLGGCLQFHKVMISKENIGLFDNMTKSDSFSKYSFPKAYNIYEQLKNSPIENLLLMEYSLGMGYVNKVYPHVSKIGKFDDLQNVLEFVRKGVQIVPFYIRGKVVDVLWKYLDYDISDQQSIQNACNLVDYVSKTINDIFEQTLEVWWYFYCLKPSVFYTYEMKLTLEAYWKSYFDNQRAYEDWIKYCGIHDWRNITKVDDCFTNVDAEQSAIDVGLYKSRLDFLDVKENVHSLLINSPINDIGCFIIKQCEVRLKKKVLMQENEDLYQEFNKIRDEIYEQMREEEKKEFYKKDVKVSNTMKTVKVSHVYAILTKAIIEGLINTK